MLCFPVNQLLKFISISCIPVHLYLFVTLSSKCLISYMMSSDSSSNSTFLWTINACLQHRARSSLLRLHLNFRLQIGLCHKCTYVDCISGIQSPSSDMYCWLVLCRRGKQTAVTAPSLQNKTVWSSSPPPQTELFLWSSFSKLFCIFIYLFVYSWDVGRRVYLLTLWC
jgi:hypothetical protein